MTCFSCLFRRKDISSVKRSIGLDEEVSGIQNVKRFSYSELRIATRDFSSANKIGQGGFGCVYKGRLKGGSLAAIKVLSPESNQGFREFLTEINVISLINHENLVKLEGCCVEGNHIILVYEFLENNSLAQSLLGRGTSRIQFSWKTRSKICIGIALSGKCNTDKLLPQEGQYLLRRAWELFERGELALLVDSLLNVDNDFDTEEACRFLKVGLLCTQQVLKRRPDMSTVVKMLQVIGALEDCALDGIATQWRQRSFEK
ncbi:hypothetical protein MRB53_018816 [Persea americana]|uniref:Uncharacterized protein n=1 Tax=Persea americana TaxID=3435 RepID=A0ACC2MAE7_PERAE|nr:hypothetical protein MRB53_018816 [Persea americana]